MPSLRRSSSTPRTAERNASTKPRNLKVSGLPSPRFSRFWFTALLHHTGPAMLRTAFYAMKRDAAPGIDGMTWETYDRSPSKHRRNGVIGRVAGEGPLFDRDRLFVAAVLEHFEVAPNREC